MAEREAVLCNGEHEWVTDYSLSVYRRLTVFSLAMEALMSKRWLVCSPLEEKRSRIQGASFSSLNLFSSYWYSLPNGFLWLDDGSALTDRFSKVLDSIKRTGIFWKSLNAKLRLPRKRDEGEEERRKNEKRKLQEKRYRRTSKYVCVSTYMSSSACYSHQPTPDK